MSTLLISMLGGAGADEGRPGHQTDRYRLPGGERIVETSHLGIELARAVGARKLALVGTTAAYFDRLVDLLAPEAAQAPVEETPLGRPPPEEPALDEAEGQSLEASADPPEAADAPGSPGQAGGEGDSIQEPEGAPSSLAPEEEPASAGEAPDGDEPGPPEAGGQAVAPSEPEPAAEPMAEATPEAGPEEESPPPGPPEGTPSFLEAGEPSSLEAAPPASENEDATTVPALEASAARGVPHRAHEPDTRSLAVRLDEQARSGRPDRGALDALAQRLARQLGLDEVQCVLISDPTVPRSTMAALRTLVELPSSGDHVHIDVTHGPRSLPVVGFLALHYLTQFRSDITPGTVFMAHPEHRDHAGVAPVVTLDGPSELMKWMEVFRAFEEGRVPSRLHAAFNHDRRLQRLAGPYVRFQRGVRFGALSEVIEGAKLMEEGRRRLGRLPYAHPYRLFDQILSRGIGPFLTEGSCSGRQLLLARQALENGNLPLAALHLRDTLISACLETYGRNPTRAWMDVPQSGGAQQVRPREVAAFILSSPAAREKASDLAVVWPLLSTARNRYVNTSPTMVPASQLKDEDHEIHRVLELVSTIVEQGQLQGLAEGLSFEDAVKQAVDLRALRPREGRRPTRPRRGRPPRDEASAPPAGEGPGAGRPEPERRPRPPWETPRPGSRGRAPGEGPPRGGPRGPRPSRSGGPGGGYGRADRGRKPEPEPAGGTPRVSRTGGLGNLGLALAQAGLVSPEEARKQRPPSEVAEELPPAIPEEAQASPAQPPAKEAPPPAPAEEEQPPSLPERGFDVAGPAAPPPEN